MTQSRAYTKDRTFPHGSVRGDQVQAAFELWTS
jgi:hypothetical protein